MASIRTLHRSNGTTASVVRWRENGNGTETSETFDDAHSAELLRDYLNANNQSYALASEAFKQSRAHGPTMAELLDTHIKGLTGVEDRTRYDYRRDVRLHILPYLGGIRAGQLTRTHVKEWVNQLTKDGCSGKSVANYAGLLSAAMGTAMELKIRKDNPCTGIRLPKKTRRDERRMFLEPEQFTLLLSMFTDHWKPLLETLAGTGLRWGECTALLGRDIRLDAKEPYLVVDKAWKRDPYGKFYVGRPKNENSFREVSIDKHLARILTPLVSASGPDGLVFTSITGKPINYHQFYTDTWRPAIDRATTRTVKNIQPLPVRPKIHALRHSHGSWLAMEGVDLTTIQHRLGHESITTTVDTYGHVSNRSKKAAAKAMGRIFK